MLKRTRISRSLDTQRMGAAVARPGMDTRTWVSLAAAEGESFYDEKYGVFVDVILLPTGERITARVPADYAGEGFGIYSKIHAEDELVIAIPSGDTAEGAVVIKRLHNAIDPPPAEVKDAPEDFFVVIEKDRHLNMIVKGEGQVRIKSAAKVIIDCPATEIGSVDDSAGTLKVLDGSKSVAISENLEAFYALLKTYIEGAIVPTALGPSGPILAGSGPATAWDSAITSTKVKIPNG